MRTLLAAILVLASATISRAQQQEKKLLDRLLKPDTTLQYEAQGKTFTVPGGTISAKRAKPNLFFFFARRSPEKTYTNVRQVEGQTFRTHASPLSDQKARGVSRRRSTEADTAFVTSTYTTHQASGADRTVEVSDYSGLRPFLVRGKSQRTLSAQNRRPPLTVEQVRELLNKNK